MRMHTAVYAAAADMQAAAMSRELTFELLQLRSSKLTVQMSTITSQSLEIASDAPVSLV